MKGVRHLSVTPRAVAWVMAALLLALILLRIAGGGSAPRAGGPRSSSLATAPAGVAAWASLLAGAGDSVRRLRIPVDERRPDPSWTVVLLDPETLRHGEATALADDVRAGGRVVLAGEEADGVLDALGITGLRREPERTQAVVTLRPSARAPETAGLRSVRATGDAYVAGSPQTVGAGAAGAPLLIGPRGPAAFAFDVGRGRVITLASSGALTNARLGEADDAGLALQLVGAAPRTVAFVESVHGYARATGLSAIPRRVGVLLGGLGAATLLFALSRARRFGDPEAARRPLDPPRRAYVEAVAATLARTGDPRAGGAPVRAAALTALGRRASLPEEPNDVQIEIAAREAGLPDEEAAALAHPDGELLATGRALATLTRRAS